MTLNPVLPPPRKVLDPVEALLVARSASDLRRHFARWRQATQYAWEDVGADTSDPKGKRRVWKGTPPDKGTRKQISKPGTGRAAAGDKDAKPVPSGEKKPPAKKPATKAAPKAEKKPVDLEELKQVVADARAGKGDREKAKEVLRSLTGDQLDQLKKLLNIKGGGRTKAEKQETLVGGGKEKPAEKKAAPIEPPDFEGRRVSEQGERLGIYVIRGGGPGKEGGFMAPGVDTPLPFSTEKEAIQALRDKQKADKKTRKTRDTDLVRLNLTRANAGLPPRKFHPRDAVEIAEKAKREGQPIPADVLTEYPDLAEKYGQKTPEEPAAKPPATGKRKPQEGDRNAQGLVFKGGRWRRDGEKSAGKKKGVLKGLSEPTAEEAAPDVLGIVEELSKDSNPKIPELWDRLKQKYPDMTRDQFDELLMEMRNRDLVTLQVSGHVDAEDRHGEGIDSPKGMYFYVQPGEKAKTPGAGPQSPPLAVPPEPSQEKPAPPPPPEASPYEPKNTPEELRYLKRYGNGGENDVVARTVTVNNNPRGYRGMPDGVDVDEATRELLTDVKEHLQKTGGMFRPNIKDLHQSVAKKVPGLSMGAFHQLLVELHRRGVVSLGAYTTGAASLPDDQVLSMIPLDGEKRYYVKLTENSTIPPLSVPPEPSQEKPADPRSQRRTSGMGQAPGGEALEKLRAQKAERAAKKQPPPPPTPPATPKPAPPPKAKKAPLPSKGEVVSYKGKKFRVGYAGKTKFGQRVKLEFLDGDGEFWVDPKNLDGGENPLPPNPPKPQTPKPQAPPKKLQGKITDRQRGAIQNLMRRVGRVAAFSGVSGSGNSVVSEMKAEIAKKGGVEKLTAQEASEILDQLSFLADDEA